MHVNILGCRGIPPAHGGFETFAHALSVYLTNRDWTVNVYCQDEDAVFEDGYQDTWNGVTRTHFRGGSGPLGSVIFDAKCTRHVLGMPGVDLVLGYNTAVFSLLQHVSGRKVLMNMDGIEWRRSKWGLGAKAWFFINELIGANVSNVVIADHPEIANHLRRRTFRIPEIIPYGSEVVEEADVQCVEDFGLTPDRYLISIARIESENSILELVEAARHLPDGFKMAVVGKLDTRKKYHAAVRDAAADNVLFLGGVYDAEKVAALRFHARGYLHGHRVGGTNPSLVEALGAGNPVIAHSNRFNRWTAGPSQTFFETPGELRDCISLICSDKNFVETARLAARERHDKMFQWNDVLANYELQLAAETRKTMDIVEYEESRARR